MTEALAALDALSTLLAALVGVFFLRVWTKSRLGLDLLLTCSFLFLTLAFAASSLQQALPVDEEDVGYPRFALELAGVLALIAAYVSARAGVRAGPALAVGWGLAGVGALFVLAYILVPPPLSLTPVAQISPYAHATMALAWTACAAFASIAWARRRVPTRAAVPLGYLALALAYYTWTLMELGEDPSLLVVAYLWRLAGIVLIGLAVIVPTRGGAPDAAA